MNMDLFVKSMEVGCLFQAQYEEDERTFDWNASEECSAFCMTLIDMADADHCNIEKTFAKYSNILVDDINNTDNHPSHMWDEICKGFLAGEILGMPIPENLDKVKNAEKLWEDTDTYGYYQEVLNEVK